MKKMISSRTVRYVAVAMLLPFIISCSTDEEHMSLDTKNAVDNKAEFKEPRAQKVYEYVEQMPKFKGGETEMIKFLARNIKYPAEAKKAKTEGMVVLSFVVQQDGSLADMKVVKGLGNGTEEESLRVLRMMEGQWTPGKQNGVDVPVRYTLPVRFKLDNESKATSSSLQNTPPNNVSASSAKVDTQRLKKFIAKNMRYPKTSAEGTAEIQYEVTTDNQLHYKISSGFDDKLATEVIRVLSLANEQGLLATSEAYGTEGMQNLSISFVLKGTEPAQDSRPKLASDIVVTGYK